MTPTKSVPLAVIAIVLVVVGPAGARFGLLPPMVGFGMFTAGGAFGLAALVWGALVKVRKSARGGALAAVLGLLASAAFLVPGAMMFGDRGPGINDITTDAADPPMFRKTDHGPIDAEVAATGAKAYPDVAPLELPVSPREALELAFEVAKARGWTVVETTDDGFEAYDETSVFRFRDDIAVRVRGAGGGARIDVRSTSRDGKADFGVNARRIVAYLADVAQKSKTANTAK